VSSPARVVRAAFWRYLSSIITYIFGFAYWTLASRLVGPSAMGYYAAITAVVGLANVLTSLSISIGVLRYAGEAYGRGDLEKFALYLRTALTFKLLTAMLCSVLLACIGLAGLSVGGYEPVHFLLASVLCVPAIIGEITYALLASTLMLKYYFYATFIGNVVRLTTLILFVLLGFKLLAVITSYFFYNLVVSLYPIIVIVRVIGIKLRPRLSRGELRDLIDVGLASWIPGVIVLVMNKLGVMFLFSTRGAFETGVYYVALTIASLFLGIVSNIQGFMLPYLAGLERGRERQMWHAHRLSLAVAVPLVCSIVPFSKHILSLLKPEYAHGWLILMLVSFNGLLSLNTQPIGNLLYVYNKHRVILKVALAGVALRAILYTWLIPELGGVGLAITDLIVILFSLAVYYLYVNGRYIRYTTEPTVLLKVLAVGILTFTIAWIIHMAIDNVLLAIPELLLGYFLVLRWRLLDKSDVIFLGKSLLPYRIRQKVSPLAYRLLDLVYE